MPKRNDIVSFLDAYLSIKLFSEEPSYNGLQFEGKEDVKKIAVATDGCCQVFEKAAQQNADMVIVHHGIFLKTLSPAVVGATKKRIDMLYKYQMSLYAAHLPLDAHPVVGNNVQLAQLLGAKVEHGFGYFYGKPIGCIARFEEPQKLSTIVGKLHSELPTECRVLPFGKEVISTVAISSGGGGSRIFYEALASGVDLLLSGEATEIYQFAQDARFSVIYAGHNATETVGVKALAKVLEQEFGVETCFIDAPTGI